MRPAWKELDSSIEFLKDNNHLIRLNRNENTDIQYNDFLQSLIADIDITDTFLYPDYNQLYYKLSEFLDISEDNILITNGGDGALRHVFEFYRDYNKSMYFSDTYKGAIHYSDLYDSNGCKSLVYICNPNNPTGCHITVDKIESIAMEHDFVLVDEAYYEFSGETALPLINKYKNIAITRSFSKAWGLAGYRIGLLLSHKENIDKFLQYRPTSPVSTIGIQLVSGLIDNYSRVTQTVNRISKGNEYLSSIFRDRGYDSYDTSKTNFVHVKLPRDEIKKLQQVWYFNIRKNNWCTITCQPIDQLHEI